MPMKSEAQRKAMHAAAMGKGKSGIPRKVAMEYAEHDQGGKLPKRAKRKAARHKTMMEAY